MEDLLLQLSTDRMYHSLVPSLLPRPLTKVRFSLSIKELRESPLHIKVTMQMAPSSNWRQVVLSRWWYRHQKTIQLSSSYHSRISIEWCNLSNRTRRTLSVSRWSIIHTIRGRNRFREQTTWWMCMEEEYKLQLLVLTHQWHLTSLIQIRDSNSSSFKRDNPS